MARLAQRDSADEVAHLVQALGLNDEEARLLTQLADEAVSRYDSESDAAVWFEREVRTRHPSLWWLISQSAGALATSC